MELLAVFTTVKNTIRHTLFHWIYYVPPVSMVNYVVKIPLSESFGKRDFHDYSAEKMIRQVIWHADSEMQ